MQRGTLPPRQESLQHYEDVVYVDLAYSEIVMDPFPTPQEATVTFNLGEEKPFAFVPLRIVDEDRGVVEAALVGELGENKILVAFPPTNWGQSKFTATVEQLESIARERE